MTARGHCRYCDRLFSPEDARDHDPCPEQVWRQRACAALGHRAPQQWVSGKTGCGYCGTQIDGSGAAR